MEKNGFAYEVRQVSFAYDPASPVLDDVSLNIPWGGWVSLVGANGCGKSTLAKLLGGLLAANAGVILIGGVPLNRETAHVLRPRIGMVFQNPDNQFIGATVEEDIAFGLEGRCLPREEMRRRVRSYAEKLRIGHLLSKHPAELSGGQKQRVAVAAILAMEPDIVIFDEASSMLDEKARGNCSASCGKCGRADSIRWYRSLMMPKKFWPPTGRSCLAEGRSPPISRRRICSGTRRCSAPAA